ncbi:MAG: glycosyltransferase, partial [Actinobacteria bacterium]|nr:glycosyltransferase [Actinomycetota bacterium]
LLASLPHSLVIKMEQNAGKGAALKLGASVALGRNVIITDADTAINPSQMPALLAALDGHDMAVGSRAIDGVIRYDSVLRTVAGSQFNRLVRHWTKTTIRDTQCGFKAFRLPIIRLFAIFGQVEGFAFDAEWLYLANRLGLTIATTQVTWDDVAGSSVSLGRDAWSMLKEIRDIPRTSYRTVVVRVPRGAVDRDAVATACKQSRIQGVVLAHQGERDIVVLPRDGAPGALSIAKVCGGEMGLMSIDELRGCEFEAL